MKKSLLLADYFFPAKTATRLERAMIAGTIAPKEALIYSIENKSVLLYCMPFRSNSKSCEKMAEGNTD